MKKNLISLLACAMAFCLLFSACGGGGEIGGGSSNPDGEVIGGDWRTWRGYTADYDLMGEDDVTFSRLDDTYGYAAYDTSCGARIGALVLPKDGTYSADNEADPAIMSKDLDNDGICEIGVCFKDGSVAWFGWDLNLASKGDPFLSNPFVWLGDGDKDCIFGDMQNESGMIFGDQPYMLTDYLSVNVAMESYDNYVSISVFNLDDGAYIGMLNLSDDAMVTAADLKSPDVPRLLSFDLTGDGTYELGVPLKDGRVFWYGYYPEDASGKMFFAEGFGDEYGTSVNSPDGGGSDPGSAGFEPVIGSDPGDGGYDPVGGPSLNEGIWIKAAFGNAQDVLTIDIYDAVNDNYYGTIQFNDPAITANDVVCLPSSDPTLITRDLDGDGTNEVGVPLLSGVVRWFSMHNGEFFDEGAGTEFGPDPSVENTMFDSLFNVLGDRLDGKMVIRSGTIEIDGMTCEEYAVGTDHEDHFVVEEYFAMAYDGTLYYYNAADGGDYILCQP